MSNAARGPLSHSPHPYFVAAGDDLLIGGRPVRELARELGRTPFYAYDRTAMTRRVAELRAALPRSIDLHYAMKANPAPAVVKHFVPLVDGIDVASGAELKVAPGAAGWQVSNPPVLSTAPLLAALEQFTAAGMTALRAKSLQLTAYLEFCLAGLCGSELAVLTGSDPQQRGCQLSIRVRGGSARARGVHAALDASGVVTDWREPDTIRLAPVPLYNRFGDALRAAQQLALALRA